VLYIKEKNRLESALTMVEFYRDHFLQNLRATDLHDLRKAHEVKNMLLNAEMKLRSSLFRTESRGNHYREDYPESDDKNWLAWVVIQQDNNGEMKLEKFNRNDYKKMIKS
jgi:succinate dehydrogenase/fumarate reductase flavoprotein subunit